MDSTRASKSFLECGPVPGMKIEIQLAVTDPADAPQRARQLAATGIDGLFTFEGGHDVFFPLVLAAGAVDVDLTTNVAMAFPRSPLHLAYAANDLQLLTKGRFRLGLGSQIRVHIERRYGSTWSRPAARMRELVLATKAIFAAWQGDAPLDFRGEFTTHTLMTPAFSPGRNPYGSPPILVGALGPRMTEITAEVADGILVMPFNSARHFAERTLPAIARGLERGGREPDEFEIVSEVIVAMGNTAGEQAAAAAGVRSLLSFYGSTPSYRPVLEVEGREALQPELNALSKQGQWAAMADRIDDDMLATLAVAGTPEECARQVMERFGARAARVCCYFPGYPVTEAQISAFVAAMRAAS